MDVVKKCFSYCFIVFWAEGCFRTGPPSCSLCGDVDTAAVVTYNLAAVAASDATVLYTLL